MSLTEEQVTQIEKFALNKYDELDTTHGRRHAERTVRLAEHIAAHEGANVMVCRLGALLHQYHPEGAPAVDRFLRSIDVPDELRTAITHCVECVEFETIGRATTLEARVVFDADKLQTIGPFGVVREVAYRVCAVGRDLQTAIDQARELDRRSRDHLQTRTAHELAERTRADTERMFEQIVQWCDLSLLNDVDVL